MLKEKLKGLSTPQKKFLLLRITGLDPDTARKMSNVKISRYNAWTSQDKFKEIYRSLDELVADSKEEAMSLLRRENQLAAIMLEEEVIQRLREEVAAGEYTLAKTNLGREVYSKLMSDLDYQPKAVGLTWEERIIQLSQAPLQLQTQEEVIDGIITEAESSQTSEYTESQPIKESASLNT